MEETLNIKIMKALLATHHKNAELYLDVNRAFPDIHPDQIKEALEALESTKSARMVTSSSGEQLFARITDHGIDELHNAGVSTGYVSRYAKQLSYAGIFILALAIGMMFSGTMNLDLLKGDLTLVEKNSIEEWIGNELTEGPEAYIIQVLKEYTNDAGQVIHTEYIVECREDQQCENDIIIFDLDKDGTIINVELPRA